VTPRPDNLRSLTSLRFFASAAIVLFHMQGTLLPMTPRPSLALGVSFFFVLSGFVLTYAHWHGALDLRRFYRTRFARLWPLHLFSGMAWLLVSYAGTPDPVQWGWPEVLNLLLLQAWVPVVGFVFAMNGVAWTISAEVFFYLLFPFLRGKWLVPIMAAAAIATAALLVALDVLAPPVLPPWPQPPQGSFWSLHAALQFPLVRLLEFCTGIVAARLFMARRFRTGTFVEAIALSAIFAFAWCSEPLRAVVANAGWSHVAIWLNQSGGMVVFAFAIFVFAHEGGKISQTLRARPFVLLGDISFSTYMLHYVVLMAFQRFDRDVGAPHLRAVAFVVVVYVCSYLAWRFLEKPAKRWIEGRGRVSQVEGVRTSA
jgi:peptidoglycan/LPS O-acetylase OafA/YrhL